MRDWEICPATIYMRVTVTKHDGQFTAQVDGHPETTSTSDYRQEAIDHALDALRRKLSTG